MNHQVLSPAAPGLGPEDLAVLRTDLLAQRRFHLACLRDLLASCGGSGTGTADTAHARRTASARMMLTDVEAALTRIDEGRYGACEGCAEPIARAHLEVVPHARYCGGCRRARRGRRREGARR